MTKYYYANRTTVFQMMFMRKYSGPLVIKWTTFLRSIFTDCNCMPMTCCYELPIQGIWDGLYSYCRPIMKCNMPCVSSSELPRLNHTQVLSQDLQRKTFFLKLLMTVLMEAESQGWPHCYTVGTTNSVFCACKCFGSCTSKTWFSGSLWDSMKTTLSLFHGPTPNSGTP